MNADSYRPPRSPAGLNTAGRRLWKAVTHGFQLRADECVLLEAACRLADETALLEAAIVGASALVAGSKGQDRPNPLFAEVRSHRLALGRLLAQLGLADAAEDSGQRKSSAGRRMAHIRWNRG